MRRCLLFLLLAAVVRGDELQLAFEHPPADASPWVYWYWMHGAVSHPGIAADLQAMKAAGIGGAYLMPIKGPDNPPVFAPPVIQLSPAWWDCVRYAAQEADRLGLKLAMHVADGFAVAGGPWITPELSMQRVVWSETQVTGGRRIEADLPIPPNRDDYYRDIELLAYPAREGDGASSLTAAPVVTCSEPGAAPQFLTGPIQGELGIYGQLMPGEALFLSEHPCWIQYAFARPFTCRSLTVTTIGSASYWANRFVLEVSDDGADFRPVAHLEPARHGWQDWDAGETHAIPAVTARYFRFVYDLQGGELGAEDMDSAKWTPTVKLRGIELSGAARIDDFEGKSGIVWRLSPGTSPAQVPADACIPVSQLVDLSGRMDAAGHLAWDAPPGRWTLLRIGHTFNGHHNITGGGGEGRECDKFNPAAARLQFDRWFGEAIRQLGPQLAGRVLQIFHIDSWECGSQNWSPVFREEFRRRRGYDPLPFLPALAGIPVGGVERSEGFLHDVRQTIADLVVDNFYRPLAELAHAHGCLFSAECVAPTFVSDDLLHYDAVDLPMGEFWLRSPTHDKLNDVLDGVSGAHLYGKRIAQSEAFTELREGWDETPALLKALGDRNYAWGMNRFVGHVFVENPWLDRKPGMTLEGVGTFLQRDQTWWPLAKGWTRYLTRCQALLQQGDPVVDVAVFTGEEIPRRAVVPWKLEPALPGMVKEPPERPASGIREPEDWIDPLHGYAYDSINPDALVRLATARDRRVELTGGARYRVVVVPGEDFSPAVEKKLAALAHAGVPVLRRPFAEASFSSLGVDPDLKSSVDRTAWNHRAGAGWDLYFVANPTATARRLSVSLRVSGRIPELWDAVTGDRREASIWRIENGRTIVPLDLAPSGSIFIVLRTATRLQSATADRSPADAVAAQDLSADWQVRFDPAYGGPVDAVAFPRLVSWSERSDAELRHYAGMAVYRRNFEWAGTKGRVWLDLGTVSGVAGVAVNGADCGVGWTPPYRVEVTSALRDGRNKLEVRVAAPWFNRMAGDAALPAARRLTWTAGRYPPMGAPLLPAGLLGPVTLRTEPAPAVSAEEMRRVYEEVKTPYKHGLILHPGPGEIYDCPSIFRSGDHWFMIFVSLRDRRGYETQLAESDDLLHWTLRGKLLPFSGTGWDAAQADGGAALVDPTWGGSSELQPFDGRYWMTYIGGAKPGYEPDPLSIGVAWTRHPAVAAPWTRWVDNPVLSPQTPDARWWEHATLYKSTVIADPDRTLGHRFVMYFNAKQTGPWVERIGMAVSDDLVHWARYGAQPVIDNGRGISGDPQIVRLGDRWVMFYFGAGWGSAGRAFDTFACSRDLVHWSKWTGPDLIDPSEPWDSTYAHKPWVLKHDGIVYHFYCAVSPQGRSLAVATSRPLSP